jgi:hypothetical protein
MTFQSAGLAASSSLAVTGLLARVERLAFCVIAALLAGCSGSQPPIGVAGTIPQSFAIATRATSDASWMAKGAAKENLLYISDPGTNDVFVYAYRPAPLKLVGVLTGFNAPGGECVDKAQDVFITNSGSNSYVIFEYAHGGTSPIAVLGFPSGTPNGCSIDPTTGNLAVAGGGVAIYKKAKGTPVKYSNTTMARALYCGYDNEGDLFVDGLTSSKFAFAGLFKNAKSFKSISLNQGIALPGGVQWDGKYLAVGSNRAPFMIYRFAVSSKGGKLAGSVPLNDSKRVYQFFVDGETVINPNHLFARKGVVQFYDYPAGGRPTETLRNVSEPDGAAVSLAPM